MGGRGGSAESQNRLAAPWVENRPSETRRRVDRRELWEYRELVRFLAGRDLKVRYKQAVLGVGWGVVRPIVGAATLTIVFDRVVNVSSDGVPYVPFALLGYSAWSYFSGSVGGAAGSLVGSSDLITKVYFPRLAAPLAAVVPGLVDFAVSALPLLVAMAWFRVLPGPALLTLPLWVAGLVVVAFSVGLCFATLNVRYRDAGPLLAVMLQLLFFLSPIAYPASAVTGAWRYVYYLNPMAGLVTGLRWSVLRGPWPGTPLAVSVAVILVTLVGGLRYFQSAERRFADVI
jgi:ABC-type polysaccharide/polyol phosphate export permease